ncbi:Glutamyl-Q tRNA(Asp) synthetase [hydrothermal vent metagenome]|uniref:Glutamyl-Q tRNA(Asp) synthetase n=1 Tax=hydrothermal vent metagenome TaxID=652676 RepID=A0A3B1A2F9_9ZZZZ
MTSNVPYRGRFAPSPTGPLHFGSLIAAVASYCQAKTNNGEWLLRIEDIDRPREVAGASDDIIRHLEQLGFSWDGPITYQHDRLEYYQDAFEQLKAQQFVYPCICSRKDVAKLNPYGIYPGTCRNGLATTPPATSSWRIRTESSKVQFRDQVQGMVGCRLDHEIGDFVVKRTGGLFSYQLAVALDDVLQHITEVVRGYDLLDSTPRQIFIQQCLGYTHPKYAHHPVAIKSDGDKLSKQTFANAIHQYDAAQSIYQALVFLGQSPPHELQFESIKLIWAWAIEHWQLNKIPACNSIEINELSARV